MYSLSSFTESCSPFDYVSLFTNDVFIPEMGGNLHKIAAFINAILPTFVHLFLLFMLDFQLFLICESSDLLKSDFVLCFFALPGP